MGNSIFFPKKRDVLYETAISATKSIAKLIKLSGGQGSENIEVDKNAFHKVFSNDPNSPTIYFLSDYEYIIYYPPFSSKYSHGYDDKCKFIQVLKGVIYDEKSELKLFKGDKIKVSPSDNYIPYTEAEEAYLRVCIGDCKSLFEQVCS